MPTCNYHVSTGYPRWSSANLQACCWCTGRKGHSQSLSTPVGTALLGTCLTSTAGMPHLRGNSQAGRPMCKSLYCPGCQLKCTAHCLAFLYTAGKLHLMCLNTALDSSRRCMVLLSTASMPWGICLVRNAQVRTYYTMALSNSSSWSQRHI